MWITASEGMDVLRRESLKLYVSTRWDPPPGPTLQPAGRDVGVGRVETRCGRIIEDQQPGFNLEYLVLDYKRSCSRNLSVRRQTCHWAVFQTENHVQRHFSTNEVVKDKTTSR